MYYFMFLCLVFLGRLRLRGRNMNVLALGWGLTCSIAMMSAVTINGNFTQYRYYYEARC
ncbi:uncharacterized protein TRIVIDRAFT_214774 [Trichoderma virens Gv29-8]|uniref:Uncharacterized protein n=1 Tax=Hypocrea virens (strain Gv29-8 / FGSC 10586) TaxID=413071 RepID=G9NCE4_HYPVG|nr:uncharacterized protein TRIVIDRAFT_214774 [Trichoderma virens Gv29-8]EHK15369.1 hypothetical protein TRIVIDRAFT_214774 [Trichoderma virens Gv29-8]